MRSVDRQGLVLLIVAALWLAAARLMAQFGAPLLPRALARQLTLHSFLSLVLVLATAFGLALCHALLRQPRRALGLTAPTPRSVAMAILAAPIVSVVSAYIGYRLALPTLIAELERGGRQAVRQGSGEFGRALLESHPATTVVWAVLLTPVAEELIFRGAMWTGITRLSEGLGKRPRSLPPELMDESRLLGAGRRWLATGGLATLLTSGVFAWMHADQSGGAGILRVVQTACLGLALGATRHATGSLVPTILLHAIFNLMTIAKLRRWIASPGWPPPLPIATLYWQIAAVCSLLLVALTAQRLLRRQR